MKPSSRNNVSSLLENLTSIRTWYGKAVEQKRIRLLRRLARENVFTAHTLQQYHELLLFLLTYPSNKSTLKFVDCELFRLRQITKDLIRSKEANKSLTNSGIVNTYVETALSIDALQWVTNNFPHTVDFAWDNDSAGEEVDEFLYSVLLHIERDSVLAEELSSREWFKLIVGRKYPSSLAWFLDHITHLPVAGELRDQVFSSLDIHIRWHLKPSAPSRSTIRFPQRPLFFQNAELLKYPAPIDTIKTPIKHLRRLPPLAARKLIDVARSTLFVRGRETDPVTYANPEEVVLIKMDRGVDLALFGLLPERRLPLESYFGFLAARNRVPVAYGGGWIFYERSEIGINIFDTFRGGESAHLFLQVLRAYHQYFEVERFIVDPFQLGADNEEGIKSGAFWFYYRLGFRPLDQNIQTIANREWQQMQFKRDYRTSTKTLKRLSQSKLFLKFNPARETPAEIPELPNIGHALVDFVGRKHHGERKTAQEVALRKALRVFPLRNLEHFPASERKAVERFTLLAALVPNLHRWSDIEKKELVRIMRKKGGPRERDYVMLLKKHQSFRHSLLEIANRGKLVSKRSKPLR